MLLPLSMCTCQCGRQLDMFGHHHAACAVAEVLGKRGFPLESVAAQVCREREPACPPTSRCATWTWLPTTIWMDVAWRWSGETGDRHDVGVAFATVLPGFMLQTMTEGVTKLQNSWLRPIPRVPLSFGRTGSNLPAFAGGVQCSRPECSQLPC